MQLHYLSQANLGNPEFIREWLQHLPKEKPIIVLHAPFGEELRDTRFVTRRLSSLLSEANVRNTAFAAYQHKLFTQSHHGVEVSEKQILRLMQYAPILIIGPLMQYTENVEIISGVSLLKAIHKVFARADTLVFCANPRSALARAPQYILPSTGISGLLAAYEEESDTLRLAQKLAPAWICSPAGIGQDGREQA